MTGQSDDKPQSNGQEPQAKPGGFAKLWWLNIIRGVVAFLIGLGLLLPFEPFLEADQLQAILYQFIGIYLLLSGLMSLIWGFSNRRHTGIWLVAGLLGLIGGIAFLLRSFLEGYLSNTLLTLLFALIMLLAGLIHLLGGFRLGQKFGRRWSLGHEFLGVVEIGIALLVLLSLFIPVENLRYILAFWGLIAGTGLIADGLRLRKLS